MNKTVTSHINGIIFHFEEEAYNKLFKYLEAIKQHFSSVEGRDEIIADIEARIAEIFQERLKQNKEVILLSEVDEVIELMGKPEEFSEKVGVPAENPNSENKPFRKRIYRNPDDMIVEGVCGEFF